jgi:hypothetical protein
MSASIAAARDMAGHSLHLRQSVVPSAEQGPAAIQKPAIRRYSNVPTWGVGRFPPYKHPMPRMLPARRDGDAPDSERKVFAAFERHLPRDWTVFHSRRLVLPRQGDAALERELDFLVIDPARGLLGLEVKGGVEIGRDSDGWYSGSDPRHRIKSPGAQVQRAMHGLAGYLRTRTALPAFGWGVVFPEAESPDSLGPDLPRQVVIDRSGLQWADKAVDGVFEAAVGIGSPLSAAAVAKLVQLLAPRVYLARSLAATVNEDAATLVRLTEEQFNILEVLSAFPRVGVSGGAGTGKTLVAMERARRSGPVPLAPCTGTGSVRDVTRVQRT